MSVDSVPLKRHAAVQPNRIAIDPVADTPMTYAQLSEQVDHLAMRLGRHHRDGKPIALRLDHGLDAARIELAALKAQVPVLSLPTFFTDEQTEHAISQCGAVAPYSRPPATSATAQRSAPLPLPYGTARITFTSGSTGAAKGVCLSAGHMLAVARSVIEAVGPEHAGRHLALLPPGVLLETVAGFLATILAGGTYVCPPQHLVGLAEPFRPDFRAMAERIADWRITSLILVPEYLAGLVAAMEATGLRLPLLTIVAVGGARVPPALVARARALGLPVRQGYGLTEFGSVVSLEDSSGHAPGSAGRPLSHIRARIADDGEILLDGPMCLGTIGCPRDGGTFATGDVGRIDATGRLWIEGRKSNLIVTSYGRNVSPEWVEAALLAQPGIAQAMVHGDDGCLAPEALLVPARSDTDIARAVDAANATLPAYARVERWREVAAFTPFNGRLTGNGRIRRDAIAAAWLDGEPCFFDELEAATFRARLAFLTIPQVQAGLAGTISRSTYLRYLAQAWHHVRHTVPLLKAARDRLAHRAELCAALDEYIDEETGHDDWILADLDMAGGSSELVKGGAPAPATRAMVAHAYDRIGSGDPVSLFGMVYVLESVSVALAQRGASAISGNLGLPPEAFTYLNSHGALDRDHMCMFADLVNRLADPSDRAAITRMAKEMFGLFGGMFASIELEDADEAA